MFRKEDSVDLSEIALDVLAKTKDGWMNFFSSKALSAQPIALDMHNSRFNLINIEELKSLLEAITECSFTKLDISENMFFLTFDEIKLKLLFENIFKSQIQILNLAKTGIVSAGPQVLTYINLGIVKSNLRDLNLSDNNLQNMSDEEFELLFLAIRNSNIDHLNLSGNSFKYLDEDRFKIISTHLKDSRVTRMTLDNCNFPHQYKALIEAILRENEKNSKQNGCPTNAKRLRISADSIVTEKFEEKKIADVMDPGGDRKRGRYIKADSENNSNGNSVLSLSTKSDVPNSGEALMLSSEEERGTEGVSFKPCK
jgi:uncharacterized protein YjbI with pentapeptide repeats